MKQKNLEIVERLYAAFGRGDIQTILNAFADNFEWLYPGPADLPLAGRRHGREQATEVFRILGQDLEMEQFKPEKFIAQDDTVVVLGHERARVKSTGRVFELDWAHVWTLRDGTVVRLQEYTDTAAMAAAFRGV